MSTRYFGTKGRLYASTSASGAAVPVASLSMWSLDMSAQRGDTTSFEDGVETSLQGFPAVKGAFSGFWDSAEDSIFLGQESSDGIKLYLYPALNAASKYWYGPAWIDYKIDVNVKNPTPISGTFVANGPWGRK